MALPFGAPNKRSFGMAADIFTKKRKKTTDATAESQLVLKIYKTRLKQTILLQEATSHLASF